MKLNYAKFAGLIAVTYVCFFFGGIFVHYFISGEIYTLEYSLMLPRTWVTAVVGLVVGWGLWSQYRLAWWGGLVSVIFQLFGVTNHVIKLNSNNIFPSFSVIIVFLLLAIFFVLILLPETKKQCLY